MIFVDILPPLPQDGGYSFSIVTKQGRTNIHYCLIPTSTGATTMRHATARLGTIVVVYFSDIYHPDDDFHLRR